MHRKVAEPLADRVGGGTLPAHGAIPGPPADREIQGRHRAPESEPEAEYAEARYHNRGDQDLQVAVK
jgi:hypothetical protein